MILRGFVLVGILVNVLTLRAEAAMPLAATPFVSGEKVSYSIKKFGVKVGEATLKFEGPVALASQQVYLITFAANSLNFHDEEKIYVDPKNFRPVRVERDLNIFGKKEQIIEEYDLAAGLVKVEKVAGGKTTRQVLKRKVNIDNLYGFIYRYRRDGVFKVGDVLTMNLPTKDVAFKLAAKEKISAAGQSQDAFLLESQPKKYQVWFDVSEKKIPLRIDGAVGLASTSMVFSGYESGITQEVRK